jgi:60 kDa SS-A/Ro ribonucleoprotein
MTGFLVLHCKKYKRSRREKEVTMKFNFSLRGRQPTDTRYSLFNAGMPDAQWDLYIALLSASPALSSSVMQSSSLLQEQELSAVRSQLKHADPEFLARLATWFAADRNFRALAFMLSAELAARPGNDERTARLISGVIRHPVDIVQWMGYYRRAAKNRQRPGRPVRKALGTLLNQLDEFQYSRCSRKVQAALREALMMLRPKAVDQERKTLFGRIVRDQVAARTTWDQEWRALYQLNYDSPQQRQVTIRDKWKEGISSFRIGYTALLNNLRPMLCAGVSGKVLKLAAEYLGNAAAVTRSGTSPLRMLEVYRELRGVEQGGAGMLAEALEKAALQSTWTRTDFGSEGISVIAMDVSSSMKRPLCSSGGNAPGGSTSDSLQRWDVAPLLAMVWKSAGRQVIAGIVGNTWRQVALSRLPVLMAIDAFHTHEGEAGFGINAHLVLQDLLRKRQVVDRVLIFTDCRLWDNRGFHQSAGSDLGHAWRQYRSLVAPGSRLYLFDLAGYGARTLEVLEDGVYLVAGWKENILDILDAASGKASVEAIYCL